MASRPEGGSRATRPRSLSPGRPAFFAAAAACLAGGLSASGPAQADPHPFVVLQALDKVTARISTIEAPVGATVRFGTLEIIVRACDKRPPEEPPESAAFLDIWEVRRGEAPASLFRGWMFASSPALSALEHPVYDVWVLDCIKAPSAASSSSTDSPRPNAASPPSAPSSRER